MRLRSLFKSASLLAPIFTLSACATATTWFKQADSALPVEVIPRSAVRLMSSHAHETAERLYVFGMAKANPSTKRAYVTVQLLDGAGKVIAEERDTIHFAHTAPGGGRRIQERYMASFPLSEAGRAARLRIITQDEPSVRP